MSNNFINQISINNQSDRRQRRHLNSNLIPYFVASQVQRRRRDYYKMVIYIWGVGGIGVAVVAKWL
jgi:hypothetical protein